MTKVTYLFGAGASANALPVVKNLPKRITELATEIGNKELSSGPFTLIPDGETKRTYQENLLKDLLWLADSSKGTTVDDFAKRLESNKEDLKRLKISLSMFFIFEQARISIDMRYDEFINSTLNKNLLEFPENIKILTWNYDYQFEKAFSKYCGSHNLIKIHEKLNVVSKSLQNKPGEGFAIFKLNGTTAFAGRDSSEHIESNTNITIDLYINDDAIHNLVNYYAHIINPENKCSPYLSFSWEKDESIVDKSISCTRDTDTLVVIGYTFPDSNREVDRKIIGAMKNLRKVYFQDPDAENIRTRFQAVRNNMLPKGLVAYPEVGSFLLPDEL